MANPLYAALGGGKGPQGGNRNFAPDLLRHIQNFQGDPLQIWQQKLQSGEITQEQYNRVHSAAEGIARKMMGMRINSITHREKGLSQNASFSTKFQ